MLVLLIEVIGNFPVPFNFCQHILNHGGERMNSYEMSPQLVSKLEQIISHNI